VACVLHRQMTGISSRGGALRLRGYGGGRADCLLAVTKRSLSLRPSLPVRRILRQKRAQTPMRSTA